MTIPKLTPYTGQVANPDGSQTQTEFTQNMFDQLSYEAQLATQLDATIDGMNNAVDEVEDNAVSAQNSANAAEAAAASAGYQGLWPDTGGSALKGETWQTQASGTPTGEYYTALQDTTVDPVGDNVNWKVQNDLNTGNLSNYTDLVFNSVADAVIAVNSNGYINGTKITVEDYYGGSNPNNSGPLFFSVQAEGTVPNDGGKGIAVNASQQLVQNLKKAPYQAEAWGAKSAPIGSVIGFDNSPAIQNAVNYITSQSGGSLSFGYGGFYFGSNVNIPTTDSGGLGQNGCIFDGQGKKATELFTDQDIDMFTHGDRCGARNLSTVQRGADGVTKWTGVAFRANGQCRFCIWSNYEAWWFKYGNLQRFSLWNTYEDAYYVHNAAGIKLARSDDMENVNNPSPSGSWNASDGWFHNMNTFKNVVFNGGSKIKNEGKGEVGFWGAIQGNSFDNVTFQNYNRDGTQTNVILPAGAGSEPITIEGGGPTSSNTFNNNITDLYFEVNHNGLKAVDCRHLSICGWFVQGQANSGTMLTVDNSYLDIKGQVGQTPGYTTALSATNNSTVIADRPLQASGAAISVDVTSDYQFKTTSKEGSFTATLTPATSGTITLDSSADLVIWKRLSTGEVTINGRIDVSSVSSPSGPYIELGQLPFPVANETEKGGNGGGGQLILFGGTPSPKVVPVIFIESSSVARIYEDASLITNSSQLYFTMTYISS